MGVYTVHYIYVSMRYKTFQLSNDIFIYVYIIFKYEWKPFLLYTHSAGDLAEEITCKNCGIFAEGFVRSRGRQFPRAEMK